MNQQLVSPAADQPKPEEAAVLEKALMNGDLAVLKPEERLIYYRHVCNSLGLNPLTRPFDFLKQRDGKLTLYARRECTEQLRRRDQISLQIVAREIVEGCYVVTARASTPDNRQDESIGAVSIHGLKGEELSNALMKAESKAKRRVTLAICGLGISDDSEVDSIPGATRTDFDPQTGEISPTKPAVKEPKDLGPAAKRLFQAPEPIKVQEPQPEAINRVDQAVKEAAAMLPPPINLFPNMRDDEIIRSCAWQIDQKIVDPKIIAEWNARGDWTKLKRVVLEKRLQWLEGQPFKKKDVANAQI